MAGALGAADLIVGRAGATTIAELTAFGRAAVLIPFPHATDDHQMANARAFEAAGACIVIPHADFIPGTFAAHLSALIAAPHRLDEMARAAHAAGRPDAAARLADIVTELISPPIPTPSGVAA